MVAESEQFFRLLAESIPNLVWTVSSEGHVDYINRQFADYLGLDLVSVEDNSSWLLSVHPDERDYSADAWTKAFTSGETYQVEYRLRRADGKYLWHLARAYPIRDDQGNLIKWFGTCTDIDSQKRVEQMFQLVMDNIPQSIFWKDIDSVYLGCNNMFAHKAGLTKPEEVRGKTDFDLAWKKEESEFYRKCDRYVMDRDVAEYHIVESQLEQGSNETIIDTHKIPLHDSGGKVIGILGMFQDITERESLRKQRDDFMETLAHDLKIPVLATIRAFDLLKTDTLGVMTPGQTAMIDTMHRNHTNLLELLQTLLQVLKYESQNSKLHIEEVDITATLAEICEELKPLADAAQMEFEMRAPEGAEIKCDRMAIRRLLTNLLSNAVKFSSTCSKISASIELKSNQTVIEISNHGLLIPCEEINKLFDQFWRGHNNAAETGLGLYLCKQIASAHGGSINATSNPETFITTFTVVLPVQPVQQPYGDEPKSILSRT